MKIVVRAEVTSILLCGLLIAQSPTNISLSVTQNDGPLTLGQTVVLGATVTSGESTLTSGKVTFYDGTVPIGVGTFSANGDFQPNEFDFKTELTPAGAHSFSALFQAFFNVDHTEIYLPSTTSPVPRTLRSAVSAGFGGSTPYNAGTSPSDIVQADFDGDGVTDLAIVNSGAGTVSVFRGNGSVGVGDGTFQSALSPAPPTGKHPTGLAVGDFNQDGIPDLVVANFGDNTVSVLFGKGDGTFPTGNILAVGTQPYFPVVGDFNGDGIADIMVSNSGDGTVSVLLGDGIGNFPTVKTIFNAASNPSGLALADFDGDGITDVAIVNGTNPGKVTIFTGLGGGNFSSIPLVSINLTAGATPYRIVAANFNTADVSDLAVSYTNGARITVIRNTANGVFGTPKDYPLTSIASGNASGIAVGDIDGDGNLDIVSTSQGGNPYLSILLGDGSGGFIAGQTSNLNLGIGAGPIAALVGDFNGDGRSDIALADTALNQADIALGLGALPPFSVSCPFAVQSGFALPTNATVSGLACQATGGAPPYTYSIPSPDSLPPGLTLNTTSGAISGSPTTPGTYGFTVQAVDSSTQAQSAVTGRVTIKIVAQLTLASPVLPPVIVNSAYAATLVAGGVAPSCVFTGTVPLGLTFFPSTCVLSGAPIVPGIYTFSVSASDSGPPPQNVAAQTFSLTVSKIATTTSLSRTAGVSPSISGQSVTLTASVAPQTASGTVTFFYDGTNQLGSPVTLSNASAALTTSAIPAGTHSVTAVYNGDANDAVSTSAALAQAVYNIIFSDNFNSGASGLWANETGNWAGIGGVYNAANGSLNPNAHSLLPFILTDFALHVETTATTGDGGIWLRAADTTGVGAGVSGVLLFIRPGANALYFEDVVSGAYGDPQGSVTLTAAPHSFDILASGNTYTVYLDGGANPVTSFTSNSRTSGQAGLYQNQNLPLGFDNFKLENGSTPTSVTLGSSLNTATFSQVVTLTANVTPASATGSVAFYDGLTSLGTATLSAGTATLQISALAVGSHSLTAVYGGDRSNAISGSAAIFQNVIANATTITLTSSPNPSTPNQGVTMIATATPAAATGTVQFLDGTTQLGVSALNAGTATLTVGLAPGFHSLRAIYSGDAIYPSSTSATVSQSVYQPLTISTTSLPVGQAGQNYSASLSAAGGSGNYTWTAAGLPAGLSISSAGSISGSPTAASSGSVTFSVVDGSTNQSASAGITLTVTAPALIISGNASLGDVAAGASVAGSYSARGGVQPYTWSLTGASGLSVDSSGNVRGSASQAGNFSATLTVTDSANTSTSLTLSLAVLGITGSFPAGTTTNAFSGSVTGVGGVPPYSYSASGIPPGLSFSGGTLSGQPKSPGTYTLGAQVTDSKGVSVSGSFSFTITGPAPALLTITLASLPDGFEGKPYSQTLGAAGGAPGYTWSQSGGQMPAGLSLSGGTIIGTPAAGSTGSYSIGVQVSDTSGGKVLGTVSINIQPAPLQITSGASLPSGQVGVEYPSQILTATGGTPPYTFSATGALPAGLTLADGQISGTPSALGDFTFTVVTTDSAPTPVTATLNISGTIKPNTPDLVLSSAATSFALTSGTSDTPSPSTILVSSTVIAQSLSFTTSSSVPWVSAGGSASTPGGITVGLNSAALSLSTTGSPYSGTVTVACTSQPCAGKSQTIGVTLTVTSLPPQLSLGSPLISFTALPANPQPLSAALSIVNTGGGSLAIQSVSAADSWITVGAFPATVAPGPGGAVTITANPAGLNPGYYLSSVTVTSAAGNASVPVTLLISGASTMTLGPAGTQFSLPQGGALGNPNGSFLISVSSGTVNFTTSVLPGADWLSGVGAGVASPASPGIVNFAIDQTAAAALGAGGYYGTIRVSGTGIVNSPQDFQVILNVSPATTRVIPDPEPAGLVFISSGATLPPQTIQLFASSTSAIPFQTSSSTTDAGPWLSVSPATGSTSAASPANITVTAKPASLKPGVYRGTVSFAFATAVRTVNITLIVQAPLSGTSPSSVTSNGTRHGGAGRNAAPLDTPLCLGAQLVPTQTGLVSNFSAPASWPTPLAVKLVDTCGNAIGGAQIVTTFSNGDPPLILSATDTASGLYSGTWTPRKTSSQVNILARASAPGYTPATVQIPGQVAPNKAPQLAPNGTYDVFHPQVGAGLGPGNIVQIYGSDLAAQVGAPTVLPLPSQVNGTSVLIGGVAAPLYYVSPGQINAQIPFELSAGSQYQVIVNANGALTTPQPIQLTAAVPAILQFNSGAVVAQHSDGTLILDSAPAAPGEFVVIYLTGLGATDILVPSGTASPSSPLANVVDTPVVTMNGTAIPILFAGLTPSLVGLYQINFQIPDTFTTGSYDLVITQDGTVSNKTVLQVQQQ